MKIQILGTAASEGWPALFCACDACRRARELGGKDLRTRASIHIDDIYKVDFPPDTLHHVHRYGLDLSSLKYLFFTHSHSDHMDVLDMMQMVPPFGHNGFRESPLDVYLSEAAAESFQYQVGQTWHPPAVNLHVLKPFESVQAGELRATPLIADHMEPGQAFFYLFEKDGRRLLYASDTGYFPEPSFEFLDGQKFDLFISECTIGPSLDEHRGHMALGDVLRVRDRLGIDCPLWITHFSHNGKASHAEFESICAPYGIRVAYDGVVIAC